MEKIKTSAFYSIMVDETADESNVEQVTICIRWIDENLEPQEDFIGLHSVDNTTASMIFRVVKDVMLRAGLPIHKLR